MAKKLKPAEREALTARTLLALQDELANLNEAHQRTTAMIGALMKQHGIERA